MDCILSRYDVEMQHSLQISEKNLPCKHQIRNMMNQWLHAFTRKKISYFLWVNTVHHLFYSTGTTGFSPKDDQLKEDV